MCANVSLCEKIRKWSCRGGKTDRKRKERREKKKRDFFSRLTTGERIVVRRWNSAAVIRPSVVVNPRRTAIERVPLFKTFLKILKIIFFAVNIYTMG